MKLWTRPSNYIGSEWNGFYVFLGRNRDSGCLTNSNFEKALEAVQSVMSPDPVPDDPDDTATVLVVSENHWAVGWVEWIAIHQSDKAAIAKAEEIERSLENYPVLDDEDFSSRETEEANQVWKNCYCEAGRIAYIRKHRSQFEFHDLADLIGCVRGNYFSGYASELIS